MASPIAAPSEFNRLLICTLMHIKSYPIQTPSGDLPLGPLQISFMKKFGYDSPIPSKYPYLVNHIKIIFALICSDLKIVESYKIFPILCEQFIDDKTIKKIHDEIKKLKLDNYIKTRIVSYLAGYLDEIKMLGGFKELTEYYYEYKNNHDDQIHELSKTTVLAILKKVYPNTQSSGELSSSLSDIASSSSSSDIASSSSLSDIASSSSSSDIASSSSLSDIASSSSLSDIASSSSSSDIASSSFSSGIVSINSTKKRKNKSKFIPINDYYVILKKLK